MNTSEKLKVRTRNMVEFPEVGVLVERHRDNSGAIFFPASFLKSEDLISKYRLCATPLEEFQKNQKRVGRLTGLYKSGPITSKEFIAEVMGILWACTTLEEWVLDEIQNTLWEEVK